MTARIGSLVGLGFALFWLRIGTSALARPWNTIIGVAGLAALAAAAWHVIRYVRPPASGEQRRFSGKRFGIAVALEVGAAVCAGWLLDRAGLGNYALPVLGIIIALHFIGLWWATGERRFVALTGAMLAVNVVALFFTPGGAAMLAISGLGSSASLAAATVRA